MSRHYSSRFVSPSILVVGLLFTLFANSASYAGSALIAVASNFSAPAKELVQVYQAQVNTQHKLKLVFGSSGKLFAQITYGAPFDVFLSADEEKPLKLIDQQQASKDRQFNYAFGRLALWIPKVGQSQLSMTDSAHDKVSFDKASFDKVSLDEVSPDKISLEKAIGESEIIKFAIANPTVAPYGAAAVDVLHHLSLYDSIKNKLVLGENISQAFQFVASRNASGGLVAWSFFAGNPAPIGAQFNHWLVPKTFHRPITQSAVLLKSGESNPAAIGFFEFLRSAQAKAVIKAYGYDVEGP